MRQVWGSSGPVCQVVRSTFYVLAGIKAFEALSKASWVGATNRSRSRGSLSLRPLERPNPEASVVH